jgi:hypothetical protein
VLEFNNPTDYIEDFLIAQEWPYQRMSSDEIAAEIEGRWGIYRLQFIWQDAYNIFHITVLMDLRINMAEPQEFYHLLVLLNERILLGHFEYFTDEGIPAYRNSFLVNDEESTKDLIEQALILALEETDRFYPAFQLVIAGDKKARDAASIAILDTAGEA